MNPETKATESALVAGVIIQPNKGYAYTINGTLKAIGTQHIYANGSWTTANKLAIGDKLTDSSGNDVTIETIAKAQYFENVYDLTIEADKPHCHFADGVLVYDSQYTADTRPVPYTGTIPPGASLVITKGVITGYTV
jgi:hypothetical protein